MKNFIILLFILLFPGLACSQRNEKNQSLVFGEEVVATIQLTFKGDEIIAKVEQIQYGAHTNTLIKDRTFLAEVMDGNGKLLSSLSIDDPQVILVDDPPAKGETVRLPHAEVFIHLPYTDNLSTLRITGQTPETKGIRKEFKLNDELKEAARRFKKQ